MLPTSSRVAEGWPTAVILRRSSLAKWIWPAGYGSARPSIGGFTQPISIVRAIASTDGSGSDFAFMLKLIGLELWTASLASPRVAAVDSSPRVAAAEAARAAARRLMMAQPAAALRVRAA